MPVAAADFALARYLPNGTLDTDLRRRWHGAHRLWLATDEAQALALQPDGKIVVAGVPPYGDDSRSLPWRAICPTAPWIPPSAAMAQ